MLISKKELLVLFGIMIYSNTVSGSNCGPTPPTPTSRTCPANYTLLGNGTLTCNSDSTWSGQICQPNRCKLYSNYFLTVMHKVMRRKNLLSEEDHTIESCIQRCIDYGQSCDSAEIRFDSTCFLNFESATTFAEGYIDADAYTYFHRLCTVGQVGVSCIHTFECMDNAYCNITTEECDCIDGYADDDIANDLGGMCVEGVVGTSCEENKDCTENAHCNSTTNQCECVKGYADTNGFATGGTCQEGEVGVSCTSNSECTANANCNITTEVCDCIDGYADDENANDPGGKCVVGVVGTRCEEDKDCTENAHCNSTTNQCECVKGHADTNGFETGGTCQDIDECAGPDLHNCSQICVNTDGGFTCSCRSGYTVNAHNDTQCDDECALGLSGCEHDCENKIGGFRCKCALGFVIDINNKSCKKLFCLPGQYSESSMEACFDCPLGSYQAMPGQLFCVKCPNHVPRTAKTRSVAESECFDLLPFGTAVGDEILLKSDDNILKSDSIETEIPIGPNLHSDFFVSPNGYIVFDKPYSGAKAPNPAVASPASVQEFRNRTIVAPLMADFTSFGDDEGNVFYRKLTDVMNDKSHRNAGTLNIVSKLLHHGMKEPNLVLDSIIVVTWNKLLGYQTKHSSDQRSSFQLVIATDGKKSYAVYIYSAGNINITSSNIFIGFVTSSDYFKTHPDSFRSSASQIDERKNTQGYTGMIFYALNVDSVQNYNIECKRLYERFRPEWQKWTLTGEPLKCPCIGRFIRNDRKFNNKIVFGRSVSSIGCTTSKSSSKYKQFGMECCYDYELYPTFGSFQEDNRPNHSGGLFLYHESDKRHVIADLKMKDICCVKSDLCHLYFQLHPVGTCYNQFPSKIAITWGDPHIQTLDGKTYTFNGHGEYVMLELQDGDEYFVIQARTQRAITADGKLSNATVISAIAARDSINASIHVEIQNDVLVVYGNGRDVSLDFRDMSESFSMDFKSSFGGFDQTTLTLSREDNTLVAFFSKSEIALNISAYYMYGLLTIAPTIPTEYRNKTGGLLGNFDGNPDNDFIFPNGSAISTSFSDREIFHWGLAWAVPENASVLKYPLGENTTTFTEVYTPLFLDEVDPSIVHEAEEKCNGTDGIVNRQCVYDYVATAIEDLARFTLESEEAIHLEQKDIENEVPVVSANATFNAVVNQTLSFNITAVDDGTVVFTVVGGNNNTQLVEGPNNSAEVHINITDQTPMNITVQPEDDMGVPGNVVNVAITICSGCNYPAGTCDFSRISKEESDYFAYAACACQVYYEGDNCEKDFDGCASVPCSLGRNCTDLSVEEHMMTNRSYNCSPCPDGYRNDGQKCADVDECSQTNGNCSHDCVNTEGGYFCACPHGYRKISERDCQDIDECTEGTQTCTQVCTNTGGSFSCSCFERYVLESDNETCTSEADYCASLVTCSEYGGCRLVNNEAGCFCNIGFYKSGSTTCEDINECTQNTCSQECTNTHGSFICSCKLGYQLAADKISCEVCEYPTWGPNCIHRCTVNENLQNCSAFTGSVCVTGWNGVHCTEDVDECTMNPNICEDVNKDCVNVEGSYACTCRHGYQLSGGGISCEDIDECADLELYNCSQVCVNTDGGFTCSCRPGYIVNAHNDTQCDDVDECALGLSGCEHDCENKIGGFNCECVLGFVLDTDRKSCKQVKFPCKKAGLNCSDICFLTRETGPQCKCGETSGLYLGADNQTCLDINECEDPELNKCSNKESCLNSRGNYFCSCDVGFKLENDQRTCTACDQFHYGVNCANECKCGPGASNCDAKKGCICKHGWTGERCQSDKDECREHPCTYDHEICTNTPGSFRCDCTDGFERNVSSDKCTDVNECEDPVLNRCSKRESCQNFGGNYACSCDVGFKLENDQRTCTACPNNTYGENCGGDCMCNATNSLDANQTCAHLSGKCICNIMWEGTTCDDDTDECLQADSCADKDNSGCYNEIGGYQCPCLVGFKTNTATGQCVVGTNADVIVPVNAGEKKYDLVISFDKDLEIGENINVSLTNTKYMKQIEIQLHDYFLAKLGTVDFSRLLVIRVSFGLEKKLTVKFSIVTTDNSVPALLVRASVDLASGTTVLQLGGSDAPVLDMSIGNTHIPVGEDVTFARQLCVAYEEVNPCQENYECVVSDTDVLCQLKETHNNLKLAIGLGIGVPLFFICALVVVCLVKCRRKNRKENYRVRSKERWKSKVKTQKGVYEMYEDGVFHTEVGMYQY